MKKRSRQLAVLGIIGLLAVQGGSIETKAAKQLAPSSVKAPTLTITEILPDSSNVEGADAYEFVEICNNANKSINLKDYRLS